MSMPEFTAEMSLYNTNKLGGHYGMIPMDTSASSELVIAQQLLGGVSTLSRSLELDCPTCIRSGSSTTRCNVFSVNYFSINPQRTYLGQVDLPQSCRVCLPPCVN
jgi:hypothetical protein